MSAVAATKHMNVEEFLCWVATRESGRYELYDGQIFAMAPERAEHVTAKFNVTRALQNAIAAANAPCQAFVDGLGVRIDEQTVYEPDSLVNCGDPVPSDALLAPAPVIIVEVLSPSSQGVDTNIKLTDYFRLPSVMHYLIVDTRRRLLIHYRRADSEIAMSIVRGGVVALDPPGLSIVLDDVFE